MRLSTFSRLAILSPANSSNTDPIIDMRTVPGFGTLQAKYHAPKGTGDNVIWTR